MFRFAQHDGKLRSVMIKLNMTNGSFSTLNMKKGNAQNYNIARKPSILSSCVALLLLQARFVVLSAFCHPELLFCHPERSDGPFITLWVT